MEAIEAVAVLDAVRLSDWIAATGLSRSTAYELLKLLGIEPEARRVPTSRKPVSHLSSEQVRQLEPWAAELRNGATLPQIRDRLGQLQTIPDESAPIVPIEPMAALAAALQPPADPLKVARGLVDAANLAAPLSSAELAALLGMSAATIGSWPDGHQPRPGFTLRRIKSGASVWWLVERPGLSGIVPVSPSPHPSAPPVVGFAACLPMSAVSLPFIR